MRKWNSAPGYWTTGAQFSSCIYCHGETMHSANTLGRPSLWQGDNIVNSSISSGNWCASCHFKGYSSGLNNYDDMVRTFTYSNLPVPPEITGNATFANNTNAGYFNHSGIDKNDATCSGCHRGLNSSTITGFMHDLTKGSASGGADCISCHDTGGIAPAKINFSAFKEGVHRNLNSNATNVIPLSETVDKACWACHGNGSEPDRHPSNYRNPRKCSSNDCHSLSQSFKAPAVYSHFRDADLNNNPDNATSYNISTKASCEACHSNSLTASGENLNASVAHYASSENLVDSMNCIYCHLDRDNAVKWGNAVEINKDRNSLVEMDRSKNKFTAYAGEFVDLGAGYRMKVTDVSVKGGSARIELYKVNEAVDTMLVNIPGRYIYEETRTINNASFRTLVIALNITGMFASVNESLVQFEGFRIKRQHYENRTTSCYLCHFSADSQKSKYIVIDRRGEYVYYTEVLFNSSDKKEYDLEDALHILANETPSDIHTDIERSKSKTLREGEKWILSENYSLTLKDVSEAGESAQLLLEAGGKTYTNAVRKGEVFDYEPEINYLGYQYRNITVFRAKVSEISQAPGIVVLEDISALSPEIQKIKDNTTVNGYNTSWLWENDTFITGRIPTSLHSPLLHDGKDGGADCVSCHNAASGFRIELGAHDIINQDAADSAADKACWVCHGDGNEPKSHPATYKNPKECRTCHVEQRGLYNATYIGDEKHGTQEACGCHIANTHKIIKFNPNPTIENLSISKQAVNAGEKVVLNATAVAGYQMMVRNSEYYIDSPSSTFPMFPVDGSFDGQKEELAAEINTDGLAPGTHLIYVRAMERNNEWGQENHITLEIKEKEGSSDTKTNVFKTFLSLMIFLAIFVLKGRWAGIRLP